MRQILSMETDLTNTPLERLDILRERAYRSDVLEYEEVGMVVCRIVWTLRRHTAAFQSQCLEWRYRNPVPFNFWRELVQ